MKYISLFLAAALFFLWGCVQEIDPTSFSTVPDLIAVDGSITNQKGPHEVRLHMLSSLSSANEAPLPVSGARVSISEGNNHFELKEVSPGLYETDSSVIGEVGKVYDLLIEYEEKEYTARDSMLDVADFEPISFFKDSNRVRDDFVDFAYIRHQFGFPLPNKWILIVHAPDSSFPYPFPPAYQPHADTFFYYTHPKIEANGLFTFTPTHYYGYRPTRKIEHYKYSLSEAYHDYLLAMFSETEWRGGIFDTAPANLPGNLSAGAIGFFSASAVKKLWYEIPDL